MCIAIVTKPGRTVDMQALYRGWTSNRDGGGFAYVDPDTNKVVISKGFMTYNEFQKAYAAAAEKYAEHSPFIIHMRIGTSGGKTDKNTHPFPIKGGALIHNGILFTPTGDDAGPVTDRKSDTRVFAEKLFNILNYTDALEAKEDLEVAIGGNKIALLYDTKEFVILNERLGDWVEDIWYSNSACGITPRQPKGPMQQATVTHLPTINRNTTDNNTNPNKV